MKIRNPARVPTTVAVLFPDRHWFVTHPFYAAGSVRELHSGYRLCAGSLSPNFSREEAEVAWRNGWWIDKPDRRRLA